MSTVLEQLQYGFDRNSRRTWQRRSLTDTQDQHYGYDSLGQVSAAARGSLNVNLTAISGRPASAQSWDYDPTGNWRGYHAAANGIQTLDQHRVHDRGNRLTQIEDNPNNMILDRVGRMRQMAPDASGDWDGKLEITWDAWSRITSVKNNGELIGNYAYDGTHRRITREVSGETLHSYYNDAWRPVEERKDAETTASTSYLWGARHRDDLVRRDRATSGTTLNETRYVLMDYFNPATITDEAGEVKERYAFSAFGLRTILNPDFTVRSSSECEMEFAFQGQFLDEESGLMNYGYRYYSPQLGRWTCKDPIGEEGGLNLYKSFLNNAVNKVDHFGLIPTEFDYQTPSKIEPVNAYSKVGLRGRTVVSSGKVHCWCESQTSDGPKCGMRCKVDVEIRIYINTKYHPIEASMGYKYAVGHEQRHAQSYLYKTKTKVVDPLVQEIGERSSSQDECIKKSQRLSSQYQLLLNSVLAAKDHPGEQGAILTPFSPENGEDYRPLTSQEDARWQQMMNQ